jgi:hypothetical protein
MSPALLLAQKPDWVSLDIGAPHDILGGLLICLLTLAIFSFLYRDNPVYKFAEHLFIGVGTAWFTMQFYESGVKGALIDYYAECGAKLSAAAPGVAPEMVRLGGFPVSPVLAMGLRSVAVLLALMLLARLVRRDAWISRWPLALMVGIYAALKMTGETQARLVQQIKETMVPLWTPESSAVDVAGNLVFVLGLLCILAHFIFTWRRGRALAGLSRVGVIMLMLAFGSRFGFAVLGRIALLIERVATLRGYAEPEYSFGGSGWLAMALTPPFLVGALVVLLLALVAMLRRRNGPTT